MLNLINKIRKTQNTVFQSIDVKTKPRIKTRFTVTEYIWIQIQIQQVNKVFLSQKNKLEELTGTY